MEMIINPEINQFKALTIRPKLDRQKLESNIKSIFKQVENNGDQALKKLTEKYDGVRINHIRVPALELSQAFQQVDPKLINALKQAKANIENFHSAQQGPDLIINSNPNIILEQKSVPIERIGIYIPGGSAPLLSTILMLALPAQIAKCSEIVLCSPPSNNGKIHPSILATAYLLGITEVYQVGGAQAIAAMTIGTKSLDAVMKIFGPGNQYVTAAKEYAMNYGVAFDLPAGPSELLIFTDGSGIPSFIAADLLSQAEHGIDSQVILVTTDSTIIPLVKAELDQQLNLLPRKNIAAKVIKKSLFLVFENAEIAFNWVNLYAPEHLIIASDSPRNYSPKIKNAGSVFLGNYCPESAGDYASGTNHTLPTNGWAKSFSGVNLDAFFKKISFQEINKTGLNSLAESITTLAREEGLEAHARAIDIRFTENKTL